MGIAFRDDLSPTGGGSVFYSKCLATLHTMGILDVSLTARHEKDDDDEEDILDIK
jgi:hypothetical protein